MLEVFNIVIFTILSFVGGMLGGMLIIPQYIHSVKKYAKRLIKLLEEDKEENEK